MISRKLTSDALELHTKEFAKQDPLKLSFITSYVQQQSSLVQKIEPKTVVKKKPLSSKRNIVAKMKTRDGKPSSPLKDASNSRKRKAKEKTSKATRLVNIVKDFKPAKNIANRRLTIKNDSGIFNKGVRSDQVNLLPSLSFNEDEFFGKHAAIAQPKPATKKTSSYFNQCESDSDKSSVRPSRKARKVTAEINLPIAEIAKASQIALTGTRRPINSKTRERKDDSDDDIESISAIVADAGFFFKNCCCEKGRRITSIQKT